MSIEFAADVAGSADLQIPVRTAMQNDPAFEVLPSSAEAALKLRLRSHPPREHWPEDAEVVFGGGRILVTVHSASRQEREYLIRLLERTLSEAGCAAKFVEQ
jgi:hypothetical protein